MTGDQTTDPTRLWLTFWIAVIGMGAVVFVLMVAVIAFHNVDKPGEVIAAVLGPVTAVVGTLAGYVAGQTAGAAGKEKAEERANVAQDRLTAVLDESPPNILDQVRQKRPDLFS